MKLHHIGKVVEDLKKTVEYYKDTLGFNALTGPIIDPIQKVEVQFIGLGFGDEMTLELIRPMSKNSPVNKFLEKGGGLHHLCYEVEDINKQVEILKQKGAMVLGKPVPGKGHGDRLTVWAFTKEKELIEFIEEEEQIEEMVKNPAKNFSEVIANQSKKKPNDVFIYDYTSKREYTYLEFNKIVNRTVRYLKEKGVSEQDRITAVIENSPEYIFFYFASIRIGAVFNPMPFMSHSEEVLKNIKLVEPKLVLIDKRKEKEFLENKSKFIFVPVNKESEFEKSILNYSDKEYLVDIDENNPACLYYSSGTTAEPKGVLYSNKNMIENISSICSGFEFAEENEVHLIMLPLGHTASINYSLLPIAYLGGKIIITESFWSIRKHFWDIISKHKVTYMETVPTVLYSILNIFRNGIEKDISSLRFVGCGSAPLQKTIQEQFYKLFGLKVGNLYGLSETGPTHIDNPLKDNWKQGSIGIPLDVNEVKIFNEQEIEVKAGVTGEIVVKGDNVFIGYFKNRELYEKVVKDGYFYTGDLGYIDEDGICFFVDRKKDLIIKGGINIVPGEIDEVLLSYDKIKEVVTVGIKDKMFGEDIKSFIVLKDNESADSYEIIEHCKKHLPRHKLPKEIEFLKKIPKTHSGKLLRRKLREKND